MVTDEDLALRIEDILERLRAVEKLLGELDNRERTIRLLTEAGDTLASARENR